VTACTFGGADRRTLYVTTARQKLSAEELATQPLAGALFALRVESPGLPEPRFALPR
jgi:sugar lactone lactonase YvrE